MNIRCIDVGAFLTAAALLAAILLLWVQLWERAVDRYKPKVTGCEQADKNKEVSREFIPGLGIVWTYLAIFCALAAFACAAWACWIQNSSNNIPPVPPVAVGFLSTAFFMAVGNVLASLFSTFRKLICSKLLSDPPFTTKEHEKCCWFILFGSALAGLVCISFWMPGVNVNIFKPVFWVGVGIVGIVAIIVVILLLFNPWNSHFPPKWLRMIVVTTLIGLIKSFVGSLFNIECVSLVGVGIVAVVTIFVAILLLCRSCKHLKNTSKCGKAGTSGRNSSPGSAPPSA